MREVAAEAQSGRMVPDMEARRKKRHDIEFLCTEK